MQVYTVIIMSPSVVSPIPLLLIIVSYPYFENISFIAVEEYIEITHMKSAAIQYCTAFPKLKSFVAIIDAGFIPAHFRPINEFNTLNTRSEYKGFSGNYTKILPELGEYGYQVPLEPDYSERKRLRKFYSIGGWCMIFQFILTTGGGILLMNLIFLILQMLNPEISGMILHEYMAGSSILASLNMLIYLVFNVLNSLIGLKWAGIKPASIIAE